MHERPHCLRLFPHRSLPNPAEVILTAAAVEAPRLVFLHTSGTVGNISPWKECLHLMLTLLSLQRGRGGCKVGIGLCSGGKEANLISSNWPNLCYVWVSTLGLVVLGTRSVSCLPVAAAEGGELTVISRKFLSGQLSLIADVVLLWGRSLKLLSVYFQKKFYEFKACRDYGISKILSKKL